MELELFISRIKDFDNLLPAEKIAYFGYFVINERKKEYFTGTDIVKCFSELQIAPYSNISAYLTKKAKGASRLFLKGKKGYLLERNLTNTIKDSIGDTVILLASDDLFPLALLENTRGYIEICGKQAIQCYDYGFYDASLVLLRKLIETLIIELFEKYKEQDKIKDPKTKNFYFLSDLISCILAETKSWTISRNTRKALPEIKKYGDLSAHNRRFNAKKSDLDKLGSDIRIVIEELVHLTFYKDITNTIES